jgi:hypothetical protein
MDIPRAGTVQALLPVLVSLSERATTTESMELEYSIHPTLESEKQSESASSLPSDINIHYGRPDIPRIVREILTDPTIVKPENGEETISQPIRDRLTVIACGPTEIVVRSQNAVASLTASESKYVSGIDFHGESYSI